MITTAPPRVFKPFVLTRDAITTKKAMKKPATMRIVPIVTRLG
jgi:hypothetical protein